MKYSEIMESFLPTYVKKERMGLFLHTQKNFFFSFLLQGHCQDTCATQVISRVIKGNQSRNDQVEQTGLFSPRSVIQPSVIQLSSVRRNIQSSTQETLVYNTSPSLIVQPGLVYNDHSSHKSNLNKPLLPLLELLETFKTQIAW